MRVLLVHPFCPLEEIPSPPLGIGYLAAALESNNVEVKVLDLVVFPYSKASLEKVLMEFQPNIIGATAVTMTFNDAIRVITDAKSISPDITTVMGGPHISFCAEETMREYPALDLAVIGEGDETVVELTDALESEADLSRIRGIGYREGTNIHFTEARPPSIDVNTLPFPARHLLPLSRYRALGAPITMTTSRGCPFQCIFCVGRKMVGAKVRYRNAQSVVDEFQYLSTLGFRQINVVDDLFTADKKNCIAICDEIIARDIKVKWTSFARADTVSRDLLKRMKQAGCYAIAFGFESANPDILKTVRKGITAEQMTEAVRMCVEADIIPHGSFILGLPGETPQTMKQTIDFEHYLDDMGALVGSHFLAPFPGTRVREHSDAYGIRILTNDWPRYTANRAIIETPTVTKEMFDVHAMEFDEGVLEKIRGIEDHIKQNIATDEERDHYALLERMGFFYRLMMNEVIEKHGAWLNGPSKASTDDVIRTMAQRAAEPSETRQEKVVELLRYALDQKFLEYHEAQGQVKWEWVDELRRFEI
jgi:anaerobic magnesium-protoporphyrin IX monomethyl ester cyclase